MELFKDRQEIIYILIKTAWSKLMIILLFAAGGLLFCPTFIDGLRKCFWYEKLYLILLVIAIIYLIWLFATVGKKEMDQLRKDVKQYIEEEKQKIVRQQKEIDDYLQRQKSLKIMGGTDPDPSIMDLISSKKKK